MQNFLSMVKKGFALLPAVLLFGGLVLAVVVGLLDLRNRPPDGTVEVGTISHVRVFVKPDASLPLITFWDGFGRQGTIAVDFEMCTAQIILPGWRVQNTKISSPDDCRNIPHSPAEWPVIEFENLGKWTRLEFEPLS